MEGLIALALLYIIEVPVFHANYADPDLGLHSLPVSIIWDARHQWVKHLRRWVNARTNANSELGAVSLPELLYL